MTLLSSCWLTIETILIPHGFEKWYRLSFFIHPLLLLLCQIFIWVQFLGSGILILVIRPLRCVWYAFLWVFRFLRNRVISMDFRRGQDDYEATQGSETHEAFIGHAPIQSIVLYHCYRDAQIIDGSKEVLRENIDQSEEEEDNEEESDVHVDSEADESSSLICSSESSITERVVENRSEEEEGIQIDEFYKKYTERMQWFDLLNYERTCGINADAGAILNKKMGNSTLLESIEPVNFSLPYISCSKEARRKLIKSLESDFEMVYVGQTCLCWEALHHQYRKVEALADSSTSIRSAFYENVAGKFQQFQVLLERFMENERIGGQRFWNYVHSRLALKYLLQVPEIPGSVGEEPEWMEGVTGRTIFAREAMKVIEKSITTFWAFIKTENKWRLRNLLWTNPQVEDPKDLHLLADLTKAHQKKELMMKNLQGRRRCCLKRTNPLEESQRLQVLFCIIDMKLVSMVLKMSLISTHQLKWCQQKLTDIDFKDGGVVRAGTSCLFPPS